MRTAPGEGGGVGQEEEELAGTAAAAAAAASTQWERGQQKSGRLNNFARLTLSHVMVSDFSTPSLGLFVDCERKEQKHISDSEK